MPVTSIVEEGAGCPESGEKGLGSGSSGKGACELDGGERTACEEPAGAPPSGMRWSSSASQVPEPAGGCIFISWSVSIVIMILEEI